MAPVVMISISSSPVYFFLGGEEEEEEEGTISRNEQNLA